MTKRSKYIRAGGGLNAHKMVMEVAIEMANELFEVYAMENALYQRLRANGKLTEKKARQVFVYRVAPKLLEDARSALTDCLSRPDEVISLKQKDEIYEALRLDSDLRANRTVAPAAAYIPSILH